MKVLSLFAVAVAAVACVCDIRSRRIPNALTFGAAMLAFSAHLVMGGLSSLTQSLAGWILGAALFFPFFALRGLGAGDVKLLAAIGAWLGPYSILFVAFYTTLVGGVMAVMVAGRSRYLAQAFRNVKFLASFWITAGLRPAEGLTLADAAAPRLAYAVPILGGLLVTLWRQ